MLTLYICSISIAVLALVPGQFMPFFIKWPICLFMMLISTYLFNRRKNDSILITNETDLRVMKRGLFHPLFDYFAAMLYLCGFVLIVKEFEKVGLVSIFGDIGTYFKSFSVKSNMEFLVGVAWILCAIAIYFLKWAFSKHANKFRIQERAAWYISLVVIFNLVCVYTVISVNPMNTFDFLLKNNNYWSFYGLALLMMVIDGILAICLRPKKEKEIKQKFDESIVLRDLGMLAPEEKSLTQTKEDEAKDASMANSKEEKTELTPHQQKLAAKERHRIEKQMAKNQYKFEKEEAKRTAKLAKEKGKTNEGNAQETLEQENSSDELSAQSSTEQVTLNLGDSKEDEGINSQEKTLGNDSKE